MTARPKSGPYRPARLSHAGDRPAALLQLVALLLILASPLLPAIVHTLDTHHEGGKCRGDHRLCGCAPARIANNTCCCAKAAAPSCCVVSGQEHSDEHPAAEAGPLTRIISTLPCGDGEPATLAAGDPWLPATAGPEISAAIGSTAYLPAVPTAKLSPAPQPDVPPPQPAPLS
jgi:hypothetical protein